MNDPVTIKHSELKVDAINYSNLYHEHGHILFELTEEENVELVRVVNQFQRIEKEDPDIDRREWVRNNINPLPSLKPLSVFTFLITQWNETTIVGNAPSPNEGFIYVSVTKEGAGH